MKKYWIKVGKYWNFIIIYVLVVLVLNMLALWTPFCDFYTDYIFGFWSETYSRLTGVFSFSVGEFLISFAVLSVFVALVFLLLWIFLRKKEKFCKVFIVYMKSFLVFLLTAVLLMTLNCSVLYHCSRLSVHGNGDKAYSVKELEILRNYIVKQCNEYCIQVERDEDSNAVYSGDLDEVVKKAMSSLSSEYPRLDGYYPNPKRLWGSYFMYQAGMIGVYFPFSMEVNCSSYLNDLFYGNTVCHELSHLKGYIYEDEANFIAYLACVNSDNLFLQYSGYIGVLDYINRDYQDVAGKDTYSEQTEISEQVKLDNWCYNADEIKKIKKQSFVIADEAIKKYSKGFTDSYLEYYGAEANYSEVTKLLLQYYDGILY
jgi:hypothetical protein